MKKILLSILSLCLTLSVFAETLHSIHYKNLKNNTKLQYSNFWSTKVDKNSESFFIKKFNNENNTIEYYNAQDEIVLATECNYDFIYKSNLICHSDMNLKFYEINSSEDELSSRELLKNEVEEMFPNFKIIALSDFSQATNSIKIKKTAGNMKIIIVNDLVNTFDNVEFATNNAKFEKYNLSGFFNIIKKGMIHFSGDINAGGKKWYILLIR